MGINRRAFLKAGAAGSALLLAAKRGNSSLLSGEPAGIGNAGLINSEDLERLFENPPDTAKPHVWWHWMDGNVTREGITANLEALKENGVGRAQIFSVAYQIPKGPIKFNSSERRGQVAYSITNYE